MNKDIEISTHGLRQALFDEINGLRNGTSSIQRANTVHKLAMEIIHITKLELDVAGIQPESKRLSICFTETMPMVGGNSSENKGSSVS